MVTDEFLLELIKIAPNKEKCIKNGMDEELYIELSRGYKTKKENALNFKNEFENLAINYSSTLRIGYLELGKNRKYFGYETYGSHEAELLGLNENGCVIEIDHEEGNTEITAKNISCFYKSFLLFAELNTKIMEGVYKGRDKVVNKEYAEKCRSLAEADSYFFYRLLGV
jgi:hypothetical protein